MEQVGIEAQIGVLGDALVRLVSVTDRKLWPSAVSSGYNSVVCYPLDGRHISPPSLRAVELRQAQIVWALLWRSHD